MAAEVQLRVRTTWEKRRRFPGDTLTVPSDVADRWENRGIARILRVLEDDAPPPGAPVGGEGTVPPKPPEGEGQGTDEKSGSDAPPPGAAQLTHRRVGTSNWYDIMRGDEQVERVNGLRNVEDRLAELQKEAADPAAA